MRDLLLRKICNFYPCFSLIIAPFAPWNRLTKSSGEIHPLKNGTTLKQQLGLQSVWRLEVYLKWWINAVDFCKITQPGLKKNPFFGEFTVFNFSFKLSWCLLVSLESITHDIECLSAGWNLFTNWTVWFSVTLLFCCVTNACRESLEITHLEGFLSSFLWQDKSTFFVKPGDMAKIS